jgi:hypothetical protein
VTVKPDEALQAFSNSRFHFTQLLLQIEQQWPVLLKSVNLSLFAKQLEITHKKQ